MRRIALLLALLLGSGSPVASKDIPAGADFMYCANVTRLLGEQMERIGNHEGAIRYKIHADAFAGFAIAILELDRISGVDTLRALELMRQRFLRGGVTPEKVAEWIAGYRAICPATSDRGRRLAPHLFPRRRQPY